MDELKKALKKMKHLSWGKAVITFYVIKRTLINRNAHYKAFLVNADDKLKKKLREIVFEKIEVAKNAREYEFETSDLDDDVLSLDVSETDFQAIIKLLQESDKIEQVSGAEQLIKSWLYVVRLDLNSEKPLFAARKISSAWTIKKVKQLINMVFRDNMLIDLNNEEVFHIDRKIDFYAYDEKIFIADKKNFESAMNFKTSMENNRDAITEEFKKLEIVTDAVSFKNAIGNNIRRLRKLSQVKKAGYYLDEGYIKRLKTVSIKEKWGLEFDEKDRLKVGESNIDIVLKVLNNDRLSSKINDENFDVDVKHRI